MSSFTRFDNRLLIEYSINASIQLNDDYWLLRQEFTYYIGSLDSNRYVRVPAGFLSDGASVPKLFRPLVSRMGQHSQAAVLHDYLIETHTISVIDPVTGAVSKEEIDRKEADDIFFESLHVLNVPAWKRFLIQVAVDLYRIVIRPKGPNVNADKMAMEIHYRANM